MGLICTGGEEGEEISILEEGMGTDGKKVDTPTKSFLKITYGLAIDLAMITD